MTQTETQSKVVGRKARSHSPPAWRRRACLLWSSCG